MVAVYSCFWKRIDKSENGIGIVNILSIVISSGDALIYRSLMSGLDLFIWGSLGEVWHGMCTWLSVLTPLVTSHDANALIQCKV